MDIFRKFDAFVIQRLRAGMEYALASGWRVSGYAPDVSFIQDGPGEGRVAVVYRIKRTYIAPGVPDDFFSHED